MAWTSKQMHGRPVAAGTARSWSGVVFALLSASLFGSMAIFARIAYAAGTEPVVVLFFRFLISGSVLLALTAALGLPFPRGRALLALSVMGLLFFGQSLTYFLALTSAPAGVVALLLYVYPAIVLVFSWFVWRLPLNGIHWGSLILAVCGAALTMNSQGTAKPVGLALSLVTAVIYAAYVLAGGRIVSVTGALPTTAVIMSFTAVAYAVLFVIRGARFPAAPSAWMAIAAIALLSTLLGSLCLFLSLERLGSAQTSLFSMFEPLVTVCLATAVLGEKLTSSRIVGGAMILISVAGAIYAQYRAVAYRFPETPDLPSEHSAVSPDETTRGERR